MTVDCFQFSGWNLEMRNLHEMKNLSPVSAVTVLKKILNCVTLIYTVVKVVHSNWSHNHCNQLDTGLYTIIVIVLILLVLPNNMLPSPSRTQTHSLLLYIFLELVK